MSNLRWTSLPLPSWSCTTKTGEWVSTASIPSFPATSSSTKSQRSSTSQRPNATTGTCARPSSRRSKPLWLKVARDTRRCQSVSYRSKSTAQNDISDEYLSFIQEKTSKDHLITAWADWQCPFWPWYWKGSTRQLTSHFPNLSCSWLIFIFVWSSLLTFPPTFEASGISHSPSSPKNSRCRRSSSCGNLRKTTASGFWGGLGIALFMILGRMGWRVGFLLCRWLWRFRIVWVSWLFIGSLCPVLSATSRLLLFIAFIRISGSGLPCAWPSRSSDGTFSARCWITIAWIAFTLSSSFLPRADSSITVTHSPKPWPSATSCTEPHTSTKVPFSSP